ncbi:MAG: TonB-dependent receptor, partial [Acidobacteria bacterium]|nr:TonB-dependent receptor [Acidobacteriota bacterium]
MIRHVPRGEIMSAHLMTAAMAAILCFTAASDSGAAPESAAQDPRPAHCRVQGLVTDPSGAVLPRVRVEFRRADGEVAAAVYTNGRGEFAAELVEGPYVVSAALAGFAALADLRSEVAAGMPPLCLTLEIPRIEDQIVVTANRSEAPRTQIGSSMTVIPGSATAQAGISQTSEALRTVPGMLISQSGGAGQLTSLFIRGGESDYAKIMVDGIPLNEPGGSYNLANLSAAGIERIEVVRGPQSALFGSDAMTGTIQIFTRQGARDGLRPAPGVMIEGGSFSHTHYGGSLRGGNDRFDYSTSFSRMDTDNDVPNGSFNNATAMANLGYRPSSAWELRALVRTESGRTGSPGPSAFRAPDPDEYFRRRDLSGGVTARHFSSAVWSQKLSYTVHDSRQFSEDPSDSGMHTPRYQGKSAPFPAFDFAYRFLNRTRRQKLQFQSDLIVPGGHLLVAGVDYERQSGLVGDPSSGLLKARRENYGAYLQDQWAIRNRLFTAVGVRLEDNDSFGFFAAPRASLAWHVHRPVPGSPFGLTKIKGNFGMGIKEPTLVESYSDSPFFRGNPDLRPERATSFDAGIEQHFGQDAGVLEIGYFHNHFRDQIGFAITDYQTFSGSFFNIGKSR